MDLAARNALVESNLGLVWAEVLRLCRRNPAARRYDEDLAQVGAIVLMRAAEGFDPGRGVRFSTYATSAIRREILRQFSAMRGVMNLPEISLMPHCSATRRGWAELAMRCRTIRPGDLVAEPPDPAAREMVERLRRALRRLSPHQRRIVIEHYGLDGGSAYQLTEIARRDGVCNAAPSMAHRKALRRLRDLLSGE